ncbi:Coiled-coil domain-containing protein 74B [Varanus komodoensis]|nr:Coiled-coil domain-containing protein 74B [Varanus komodoensis]
MQSPSGLPALGSLSRDAAGPGPGPGPGPPALSPPPPPWRPGAEAWRRVAADLERSLEFLRRQHAETLQQLHDEVDRLKRQNRDFFSSTCVKSRPRSSSKRRTAYNLNIGEQSEEDTLGTVELEKKQVNAKEEESTEESIEGETDSTTQKESEALHPESEGMPTKVPPSPHTRGIQVCDRMTSPNPPSRPGNVTIPAASSNPFLVNVLPSYMRKPPTLEECEVVIRQLWNINHMQMQELMYLRSCLEDIHKTKRIPEDYLLAGQLGSQETIRLPRVKNVPKKCRILAPLPAAERAVLPALKQTLGNAFAERQKRAQAIQRNRLHRTAL